MNSQVLFDYNQPGRLFLNIHNRYFEASETYRGDDFITDTLVTNKIYSLNISASRILNNGWSVSVTVPISANSRENSGDHGGPKTPKYITRSYGLGDVRLSVYKWLLNSSDKPGRNIQLGLGLKLPTGDYEYRDYFTRNDSTQVIAPVDQAIQLGDGGLGITFELNGFYSINKHTRLFANGFYLLNPRDHNGVSNLKGRTATMAEINNHTTVMSVPDQMSIQAGAAIDFRKISIKTSIKYDKVPENDVLGNNRGFRRAASILSFEPGISYQENNCLLYFNLGVPVKRKIILNQQNNMTPAGFADYIFSFGAGFRL